MNKFFWILTFLFSFLLKFDKNILKFKLKFGIVILAFEFGL